MTSRAQRRYNIAVLLCSAGYVSSLWGAEIYFRHHPGAHGVAGYVAAIVPALLIVCIFAAIGRYLIEEQDEYLRLLMVRQTLVASGFMLTVATMWGFLETFRLVPHVDAYWAAILWFGGLGLGAGVNKMTIGRAK